MILQRVPPRQVHPQRVNMVGKVLVAKLQDAARRPRDRCVWHREAVLDTTVTHPGKAVGHKHTVRR